MQKIRRYDLDWLRVLVFGLLIFYHVGMFFVPWGWHIKNNIEYDWMRWPMLFVNQWRLAILFVISGMGTRFALAYRSGKEFSWERIKRLGLPLVVGMLLIVPPQVYFQRIAYGQFEGNYFEYFFSEAFVGIYPTGNFSWHHLWFLPYLLTYSLVLTPFFLYLRKHPEHNFLNFLRRILTKKFSIYIFIIPLYLIEVFIEPFFEVTHNLVNDWFTFINFLTLFFFGYLLISVKEAFWKAVNKIKNTALIIGIIAFAIQVFIWHQEDNIFIHFIEAFVKVTNFWSWILVLFGFAAKFLNQKSELLSYCNTAVYPFYILHQTVTVALGFYMMNWEAGLFVKFTLLSLGTFFISWILYEFLIRRVNFLRPLFGLKGKFEY